ncbi:MAG: DUF1109 domain-containing protein [Chitinophagales bacterium]|nr:DUF1109 domain-containing protein [Hyphomicrobiales bacterium]
MRTNDLIGTLSQGAKPVRPLRSPVKRVLFWLAISLIYAVLVVAMKSPRPDLIGKLAEQRFTIEVVAAFLTAILSAVSAFSSGIPGRPIWERFLPLPPLVVWLASLGEGCLQSWLRLGTPAPGFTTEFMCIPNVMVAGLAPGIVMLWMIRKSAPISPILTTALATLAASAFGAAVLRLYHTEDASLMVLVWQFGAVALFTALGALVGRRWLYWRSTSPKTLLM